jgi:hypothetical protein
MRLPVGDRLTLLIRTVTSSKRVIIHGKSPAATIDSCSVLFAFGSKTCR